MGSSLETENSTKAHPPIDEEVKTRILDYFRKAKARGDVFSWKKNLPTQFEKNPLLTDAANAQAERDFLEWNKGLTHTLFLNQTLPKNVTDSTCDDVYASLTLQVFSGRAPELFVFIHTNRIKDAKPDASGRPVFHGRVAEYYYFDGSDLSWFDEISPAPKD